MLFTLYFLLKKCCDPWKLLLKVSFTLLLKYSNSSLLHFLKHIMWKMCWMSEWNQRLCISIYMLVRRTWFSFRISIQNQKVCGLESHKGGCSLHLYDQLRMHHIQHCCNAFPPTWVGHLIAIDSVIVSITLTWLVKHLNLIYVVMSNWVGRCDACNHTLTYPRSSPLGLELITIDCLSPHEKSSMFGVCRLNAEYTELRKLLQLAVLNIDMESGLDRLKNTKLSAACAWPDSPTMTWGRRIQARPEAFAILIIESKLCTGDLLHADKYRKHAWVFNKSDLAGVGWWDIMLNSGGAWLRCALSVRKSGNQSLRRQWP